jgi:hypothetical protein
MRYLHLGKPMLSFFGTCSIMSIEIEGKWDNECLRHFNAGKKYKTWAKLVKAV